MPPFPAIGQIIYGCSPKPILINCGAMKRPYAWAANIVDTQIIRIGGVVIAALPGEFTTMSGRRVRNALWSTAGDNGAAGDEVSAVLLSGLSNAYTDYIATFEEYQQQGDIHIGHPNLGRKEVD